MRGLLVLAIYWFSELLTTIDHSAYRTGGCAMPAAFEPL